jgi:hypothetical protein
MYWPKKRYYKKKKKHLVIKDVFTIAHYIDQPALKLEHEQKLESLTMTKQFAIDALKHQISLAKGPNKFKLIQDSQQQINSLSKKIDKQIKSIPLSTLKKI